MNAKKTQADEIKHVFHIEDDGTIVPRTLTRGSAVPEVPPGVYSLIYEEPTPISNMKIFLRPEAEFKAPAKLYGADNIEALVDRFMRSYEINDKNLGMLLAGEKGSGKTMLLKVLSIKAIEMGFPVILVNDRIPGDILNWFMSTIHQPTLVNFDEFEKTYVSGDSDEDEEAQRAILQLLDGTNTGSKKMFCFTVNKRNAVSQYLLGRPSRIRYVIPFDRIDVPTVVEYVTANLKAFREEHLRAFIHLALADADDSNGINFDSMAEFVKEMNQFNGDLNETLKIMGATGIRSWSYFDVVGYRDGQRVYRAPGEGEHKGAYIGRDPMEITFNVLESTTEDDRACGMGEWKSECVVLTQEHFVGFGDSHETLLFAKDGVDYHLTYTRHDQLDKLNRAVNEDNAVVKKRQAIRKAQRGSVAASSAG